MAKLIVRDKERTCLMDLRPGEAVVIGRSHDCEIPVQARRASRRHAEIGPAEGGHGHAVRDLDSTNGTLLNGAPFPDVAPLSDGDLIDVGGCHLTYREDAPGSNPNPSPGPAQDAGLDSA